MEIGTTLTLTASLKGRPAEGMRLWEGEAPALPARYSKTLLHSPLLMLDNLTRSFLHAPVCSVILSKAMARRTSEASCDDL